MDWLKNVPADLEIRRDVKLDQLGGHKAPILRIASYNVCVDHDAAGTDGVDPLPWDVRCGLAVDVLEALECDLVGIQEPSPDKFERFQTTFEVS